MDELSARELILTLIDSAAAETLSARYFVAVGNLFEMDAGNIRVALARLVKDGSLRQAGRGSYCLGSRSGALHTMVRTWSRVEDTVKPWTGHWLTVLTGHLGRGDKTRLRGRERALRLYGFALTNQALWVRPDNLHWTTEQLHRALTELGLDRAALVAVLGDVQPAETIDHAALWDRTALEQNYTHLTDALHASTKRLRNLSDDAAARETLLLGRRVTRQILLDPLLPQELVDTRLRHRMIQSMRDYDKRGKAYFRALYAAYN